MADEDLALEGEETRVDDTAEQHDDTPEPIANLARELGWAPKDEFRGDPDKWKPADQFIRDGRDIQRTMADRMKGLESQIERFGRISEQLVTDKVAERDSYWQQQLDKAVDEGDHDLKAKALAEIRKTEQTPPAPPPELSSWMQRNTWYNTDPAAQVRAQEVADRLAKQGKSPAEQLEAAEKIVRREFPEYALPTAKTPPATNNGGTRTASPSNRAKGFADMPAESQRMARDMADRNPSLTVEAIAKSYWQDVNSKKGA